MLSKSALKWTTGINWSTGDTKLTKLSSDAYQMAYLDLYRKPGVGTNEYFFRVEEGGKIGQFYGYEHAGIDENGLLLVYDNDGNAKPAAQADPSWKRNIGNGAPKHFLSWSNSFRYKNWDLSTLFRGAFGLTYSPAVVSSPATSLKMVTTSSSTMSRWVTTLHRRAASS